MLKAPLYVLPHGIEVVGEYAPKGVNRYWRVRIRPHAFFPDAAVQFGGVLVRRSRAVLAAKLGRALTAQEHAHHGEDGPHADTDSNLEVLSPVEHNRHHKTGSTHAPESKRRISESMKRALAEGRHAPLPRDTFKGKKHSAQSKAQMSATRKALIASGAITMPRPPSCKGKRMAESTKQLIRVARLAYWQQRKATP